MKRGSSERRTLRPTPTTRRAWPRHNRARYNRLCVRGHRDLRLNNFGATRFFFLGRLKRASEKHLRRGTFFGFLRKNHNAFGLLFGNKIVVINRIPIALDRITRIGKYVSYRQHAYYCASSRRPRSTIFRLWSVWRERRRHRRRYSLSPIFT